MTPTNSICRILVVDDDQGILETYRTILSPPEEKENSLSSELYALSGSLFGNQKDDQNPADSEAAETSYKIVMCQQGEKAVEAVKLSLEENRPFSIAFLDIRMPPGPDGVWTAEQIRKIDTQIEFVMVTGYSDLHPTEISHRIQPRHKLLYIQKPFHQQEITQFAAALCKKWQTERELQQANKDLRTEIAERKNREEEIKIIAYHDSLTGLPNRKSFYERLEADMGDSEFKTGDERRKNKGDIWALMFLDLDKFKDINDSIGHDAGDELLRIIGRRIRNCLRKSDNLFRLGGDEFTVILRNLKYQSDLAKVAEKIRTTVSHVCSVKGHDLYMTVSIGISIYPENGDNVETLVKNADMAMYVAKDTGYGYHFFTEEMNKAVLERMKLESRLHNALKNNEFTIYYQPLLDNSNRIVGAEALLRWQNPEMGMVSPNQFIPLAEETGVIIPIGEWVLHTACQQAKSWYDMGNTEFYVAVNLSPRQFKEPGLLKTVEKTLEATGLPPHCLTLEITESGIMENPDQAIKTMQSLRERGIRFSIDDFGTGYSSLSHLKQFPIDSLKIDRSFTKDCITNKEDQEIIKTIITMAYNLNINLVAEGVETEEQHDFMTDNGCQVIQGFYHGRPVPPEEFEVIFTK